MNQRDVRESRRRVRRRSGALMALIVAPIVLFAAAAKILEVHYYPAGDVRNEPLFWAVTGVIALVVAGVLVAGAIRGLNRHNEPDPPDD